MGQENTQRDFEPDARLLGDSIALGATSLCLYRLVDDARWPWVILIPRRPGVTELHQLTDQDHEQLCMESRFVARAMAEVFSADSMNVAKLGNVVSQLHLHHVVRYRGDAGWPGPVWGLGQRVPYEAPRREDMCNRLRRLFDYLQDPEQDEPPLTGS